MLIRAYLSINNQKISDELKALFKRHDVFTITHREKKNVDLIFDEPFNILIISEENLSPYFLEGLKNHSKSHPAQSSILLTDRVLDKLQESEYLASGFGSVVSSNIQAETICMVVENILIKHVSLQNEMFRNKRPIAEPRLADFVSTSSSMLAFMGLARKVVNSDSTILILGETGVGKERLALAIHGESKRKESPFIAVNCAAIPDNLLESELFGFERGAFTGAVRTRRGAFELAHKGTIFLDEIGDMPLHLQVKILRVIQKRKFQKIGSEKSIEVDVRIMVATNKDLLREVEKGSFRRDLYYRIGVICLTIPPLSERAEDIPELVRSYIEYLAPRIGVSVKSIDPDAVQALMGYSWPGNVRELINVLERAMLICGTDTITTADLPEEICPGMKFNDNILSGGGDSFFRTANWTMLPWKNVRNKLLNHYEKIYIRDLLAECRGNVEAAASKAGLTPRALYHKAKSCHIVPKEFKYIDE
ncbi:MAG: hypothetical protein A2020_07630 [Lentisphaerae bacterium GWF2_45_14]|nr:MAG: hypothetical protein A2020_07630 [Lentisphaerae bacterium GWF2_45_14]